MHWIAAFARIVGTQIPFSSAVLQLSAEMESHDVQKRLEWLEDPISTLHPDVRDVSKVVYEHISASNKSNARLAEEDLKRYSRVLAILEANKHIRGVHAAGHRFVGGFWLSDPFYVLYMATLYEDDDLMERFIARVESSEPGTRLNGQELAKEFALPEPTVRAVFEMCEKRGLGVLSKELSTLNYLCQA